LSKLWKELFMVGELSNLFDVPGKTLRTL